MGETRGPVYYFDPEDRDDLIDDSLFLEREALIEEGLIDSSGAFLPDTVPFHEQSAMTTRTYGKRHTLGQRLERVKIAEQAEGLVLDVFEYEADRLLEVLQDLYSDRSIMDGPDGERFSQEDGLVDAIKYLENLLPDRERRLFT